MTEIINETTGEVTYENPVWAKFKRLFNNGRRIMDDTPIELPVGYVQPLTLEEKMARIMRNQRLMEELDKQGFETFEEADNFDCGEDDDDYEYGNDFDAANIQAQRFGVVEEMSVRDPEAILKAVRLRKEAQATTLPNPSVGTAGGPPNANAGGTDSPAKAGE